MKRSRYYKYPVLSEKDINRRRRRVNRFLQNANRKGVPWNLILIFVACIIIIPVSFLNTVMIFLGENGFLPFVVSLSLFLCGIVIFWVDGTMLVRWLKQREE